MTDQPEVETTTDQSVPQPMRSVFYEALQKAREELLDGPAPLFTVSHTGTTFDYTHQCAVAKGMVSADRTRQLLEQSESNNRSFDIEFPAYALAVASPAFKRGYESIPTAMHVPLDLGNVLPGYAMCVLDWYARALRSRIWHEFVPGDASFEGEDKWYWVYCYSAMRSLGMDEFAARLLLRIEAMMGDLAVDFESYAHLLRALQDNDPILSRLVELTAHQMRTQTLRITADECHAVAEHFPRFAQRVNEVLQRQ